MAAEFKRGGRIRVAERCEENCSKQLGQRKKCNGVVLPS